MKKIKGQQYSRKVKLNSLDYEDRFEGKQVQFDQWHTYTVVWIDGPKKMAYLLKIGPLE